MKEKKKREDLKALSFQEEIGNSISHGLMALLALCFLPMAAIIGYRKHGMDLAVANSIYLICIFFMFLMSTLYHSMPFGTKLKKVFRILDHSAIYFSIAGGFTPISVLLWDSLMIKIVFIFQWLVVIFGTCYKAFGQFRNEKFSLFLYLFMGWTALLLFPKIIETQSPTFLYLMILGGIFYSLGTIFYAKVKKDWGHFCWHIFVILGALSHVSAIILFLR